MVELRDRPVASLSEIADLMADSLNMPMDELESDLIESGILDSLMLVDLIVGLEGKYGIVVNIEDLEFDNFRNVQSICDFVNRSAAGMGSG